MVFSERNNGRAKVIFDAGLWTAGNTSDLCNTIHLLMDLFCKYLAFLLCPSLPSGSIQFSWKRQIFKGKHIPVYVSKIMRSRRKTKVTVRRMNLGSNLGKEEGSLKM